jgi:hypothetical protein
MFLSIILLACSACISCAPNLPLDDNKDDNQDNQNSDSGQSDSGDTAVDTSPPPACPVMEEEPNGDYDNAQIVLMEKWICGTFDEASESAADLDVYSFTTTEEGWVKTWVRGEELGSSADLMLTLKIGSETAISTFSPGTTDPSLVLPLKAGVTVFAAIQDQFNDFGDNLFYEALFTTIKPPVEYNMTEDEILDSSISNDGLSSAQEVESEDRVFGTISNNFDRDWYFIDLPPGEQTLQLTVEAHYYGSPIDLVISLFPPETFDDPSTSPVRVRNSGPYSNSFDPYLEYGIDDGGKWGILLESNTDTGSDLYWYVLDIQSVSEE